MGSVSGMVMHTEGTFQAILRTANEHTTGKRRNILLPGNEFFQLSGDKQTLRLCLTQDAVTRNMQENVAAFDSWILALKAWGCADQVVLRWQEPQDTANGHYQRFLYRVSRFRDLFSDWFVVDCKDLLHASKLNHAKNLLLNMPMGIAKDVPHPSSLEAILEKYLVDSGWLAKRFRLKKIGRQFPVGLFADKVAKDKMIFTGGKSAVDLVGIDPENTLWVFELKAKGNQPLGIVSELIFYTSMMRDLALGTFSCQTDEALQFDGRLHPNEIVGIKTIRGCLLAPAFHPLLANSKIVDLLNTASNTGAIPVHYCSVALQ